MKGSILSHITCPFQPQCIDVNAVIFEKPPDKTTGRERVMAGVGAGRAKWLEE